MARANYSGTPANYDAAAANYQGAEGVSETFFLPGFGVVVDVEDGDEVFIPDYGVVANNEAVPSTTIEIPAIGTPP